MLQQTITGHETENKLVTDRDLLSVELKDILPGTIVLSNEVSTAFLKLKKKKNQVIRS